MTGQKCKPNNILLALLVMTLASCEQPNVSREYVEIVSKPPANTAMSGLGDPRASMGRVHPDIPALPPDHPDISGLPPDHPDISGLNLERPDLPADMQLPAGQNSPEMQKALDASVARPPLSWQTPSGWSEQKGGGMRLVTFNAQGKSGPILCTIISLGGQAGGLEQNVARWIKQINIDVPGADQLSAFIAGQEDIKTKEGFSMKMIDLSGMSESQMPSMIASVAELPGMTIFVKMTGNREAVIEHRRQFKDLCGSLVMN